MDRVLSFPVLKAVKAVFGKNFSRRGVEGKEGLRANTF